MDFFQLLHVHLEHQSLVRLWRFCPFPSFIIFCVCSLLDLFLIPSLITLGFFFWSQGYHTGVVMEEHCTREVSDRDATITALKAEIERLEGEKGGLSDSLTALRLSLTEKEREKDGLRADLAKAQEAEVLSVERACRANELTEGLRRELASEKESAAAVREQLYLTTRRLDSVKGVLTATVGHYRATVTELGGETSTPPEEDSVYALAS